MLPTNLRSNGKCNYMLCFTIYSHYNHLSIRCLRALQCLIPMPNAWNEKLEAQFDHIISCGLKSFDFPVRKEAQRCLHLKLRQSESQTGK